jgi:cell division septum initiation protein DivIVA
MDDLQFRDARLRISHWIEETPGVFAALPIILQEHDRLRERLDATERAAARLLQEVNDLRRELDALQSENERLRRDRAETAEVLTEGLNRVLQETVLRLRASSAQPHAAREPSFS